MTSVLVVDDQDLIRAGLVALLRTAPGMEVVGEAQDGETAVARAMQTRPDVVLMDIRMPGMDGTTAAARILSSVADPVPQILMLTTFDLDEYVYAALRVGASGFLLKDTGPEQLVEAVNAVARGDMLFAPSVTRRLIEAYIRRADPAAVIPARLGILTTREREVLRLTAAGLSNAEIAGRLHISEATVKTHLNRTMSKLHLESRAQAVVLAYESGLVVPGEAVN
ncbi:response regulator transcription factor [Streptomyces sp. NPDC047070]|uniref:response regulator transcription factor n=1 Tax=Streptomyces sp. NPDC047070 TaxID=3154923 RepID=UPI003452A309